MVYSNSIEFLCVVFVVEKINKLLKKKKSKIAIFVILDILIIFATSILALWLRFDFSDVPSQYMDNIYTYLLPDVIIMLAIFTFFKLYISVWSYASILELFNVVLACFATEIIMYFYKGLFDVQMPKSFYFIQVILMVICVGGTRYFYRILRAISAKIDSRSKTVHTMIIGGGKAAILLIDEINRNQKDFNTKIVCIVDDDKEKIGSYIRNIPVKGDRKDISRLAEKYHAEEIIIAIPSAPKSEIDDIVTECQKTKCNIKILPSIYLTMNGKKDIVKSVRPLSYEDFLGRDQIVVDASSIAENITGKRILVTGGGGSIGSELCRQIAKCKPEKLVIFDIYENNAYDIQQELLRNYPKLNLEAIIGSVRDYDRLEKVFKEEKPEIVFHAAAHKHVPLMEVSPNEAIKNNCLGTLNACKLADKYKVKKFVLISTDKAVRPTNVMGASKRICEMIMQTYDKLSKNTDYVAVRFGNVLGSNGSVIPLFLKQIDAGGPVTVTHKEITRFFMTIPEAVSLVLQASVYALGGEIFVLDMGEPVKIYDLAQKLIRYKGFEPNVDIKIEITGLRPGEKLYEEILMDEEGLKETPNKLIHIGQPLEIDKDFLKKLDSLIKSAYENKDDIKEKVAKIVTTYKITDNK